MADLPALLRALASSSDLPASARGQLDALVAVAAAARGADALEPTRADVLAPTADDPARAAAERSPGAHPALPPRYADLGRIASGGMGEVRRVLDREMGRVLAVKLLAPERAGDPEAHARFLDEARLTAGLQHPGVVPVHDRGVAPDGTPWFTMSEVRGSTLRAVIRALHAPAEGPDPAVLRRVLDAFARACEAVAYAHGRGVVHRDLKPDNVMIGEFGEVLVMDWGLAVETGSAPGPGAGPAAAAQAGRVVGTPAYMSPEQARGEARALGPASDVYALGAILYEILAGAPPYEGSAAAVLAQVLHAPPAPLARRARAPAPPDLVAACERAMARDPDARHRDARALVDDVRQVLDGARRRERALALVAEAKALAPSAARLRERARDLRARSRARLGGLSPHDPVDAKAPAWALEDEARALDREAAAVEVAWQQKLYAALNVDPELPEAHDALADAHAAALHAAEEARDDDAAARAEALLRAHDRGRHGAVLRGDGALTLHTAPAGAEVELFRYVERGRRMVPEPAGALGRTPLRAVALPRGSYLLRVTAPGFAPARYPVHIARGAHWDGVRPGEAAPFAIPLVPAGALGDDECYVPAGWCVLGGDPTGEMLPRARVWVDGFVIRRHPVTQAEYLAFLNALVEAGRGDEAEACCPRVADAIAGRGVDVPLFERGADGRFSFARGRSADEARHPVASIDWLSAARAAAWFAREGAAWRLPHEFEREKAARGADGRSLPWGDQLEPTWACVVGSRPGAPSPSPVDAYETDESPYGVRGLAGNTRDWCADAWTPDGAVGADGLARALAASPDDPALRVLRGGAWTSAPMFCRAAARYAAAPGARFSSVGLRLARAL